MCAASALTTEDTDPTSNKSAYVAERPEAPEESNLRQVDTKELESELERRKDEQESEYRSMAHIMERDRDGDLHSLCRPYQFHNGTQTHELHINPENHRGVRRIFRDLRLYVPGFGHSPMCPTCVERFSVIAQRAKREALDLVKAADLFRALENPSPYYVQRRKTYEVPL